MDMTQKHLLPPATLPPALRILLRARELISEPEHWTQGPYARDSAGLECRPQSNDARSFCLLGSLRRAEHELTGSDWTETYGAYKAIQNANPHLRDKRLAGEFNDLPTTTHRQVIRALDNAIAAQRPTPPAPWYHRFLPHSHKGIPA